MTTHYTLQFDIQSEWHIGSGEQGGAYADALALKDTQNLPYIPGRAIKGLLREAVTLAHDNSWFVDYTIQKPQDSLFGYEGDGLSTQGCITISSATLEADEKQFIVNHKASSYLYRAQYSTAIDHDTGVAKNTSLRSLEVVVPVKLFAKITINGNDEELNRAFENTLPLITHLGAKRHRGLGSVVVSIVGKETVQ
jgi:CRISPR/Cas system CSM-associated protein Csm3 (group 7 of RAMP superfamily)